MTTNIITELAIIKDEYITNDKESMQHNNDNQLDNFDAEYDDLKYEFLKGKYNL